MAARCLVCRCIPLILSKIPANANVFANRFSRKGGLPPFLLLFT